MIKWLPGQVAQWAAEFRDAAVRRGFIRKVLFIVTCMLAFTVGCALTFYFVHPLKVQARDFILLMFFFSGRWNIQVDRLLLKVSESFGISHLSTCEH